MLDLTQVEHSLLRAELSSAYFASAFGTTFGYTPAAKFEPCAESPAPSGPRGGGGRGSTSADRNSSGGAFFSPGGGGDDHESAEPHPACPEEGAAAGGSGGVALSAGCAANGEPT